MLEDRISHTGLERRSNPSQPQESSQRKSHTTKSFQIDCLNTLHREGLLVHPQIPLVVLHGRKRVHRQEHSEGLHAWSTWMHCSRPNFQLPSIRHTPITVCLLDLANAYGVFTTISYTLDCNTECPNQTEDLVTDLHCSLSGNCL